MLPPSDTESEEEEEEDFSDYRYQGSTNKGAPSKKGAIDIDKVLVQSI